MLLQKSVYFLIITLCRSASVIASASVHRIVEQEDTDSASSDEYERQKFRRSMAVQYVTFAWPSRYMHSFLGALLCKILANSLPDCQGKGCMHLHVLFMDDFLTYSINSRNKRVKLHANRFSEKSLSKKGDLLLPGR